MSRNAAPRVILAWLIWWVLLAALYAVLADNPAEPELFAGAGAAAIGATGAVLVRSQRRVLLRPRLRWLRGAWGPLVRMVTDLWPLVLALVETGVLRGPGRSGFVEVPFAAVGDDPEDTAYRALTESVGSLAPNTLVVHVDTDRGVLVAHQLRITDDPAAEAVPLPR
jgi:multisubunit Na+/H+ antiporter MnhE subunit